MSVPRNLRGKKSGRSDPSTEPYIVSASNGGFKVDASELHAPTDVYDADYAWVTQRNGAVSFFFAKGQVDDSETLRTRLEVRYPFEGFVHHFWRNSREFHKAVRERRAPDWGRGDIDPSRWKSEKDHSVWANLDYLARSGSQASMDFYELPPWNAVQFNKAQDLSRLRIVPVVRIVLTTDELCRLLDASEPIAEALEGTIGEIES